MQFSAEPFTSKARLTHLDQMKYLTVVYYDTFARFFSSIEDEVKARDSEAEFLHLALFPSAYLYLASEGKLVRLLPWEATKVGSVGSILEEGELDRIGAYHSYILSTSPGAGQARVRKRAAQYVETFSCILNDFRPDRVIMSGDTRIACEALTFCLERDWPGVVKFHFEQGPGGTTILDPDGVNANCSFRGKVAELTGDGYSAGPAVRRNRFKRGPFLRAIDHVLCRFLGLISRLPVEWETLPMPKCSKQKYAACLEPIPNEAAIAGPRVLVALQVPDDANNIHHNPLGLNDADFVKMAVNAVRQLGGYVIVREHPLYRRKYSSELYHFISITAEVVLSNAELRDDLSIATLVITVNSMTGLDAYISNVPAILMGRAFYDHLRGVVRVDREADLVTAVDFVQGKSVADLAGGRDPSAIFAQMKDLYLIEGHMLDDELVAPAYIADVVVRRT